MGDGEEVHWAFQRIGRDQLPPEISWDGRLPRMTGMSRNRTLPRSEGRIVSPAHDPAAELLKWLRSQGLGQAVGQLVLRLDGMQ